MKKIFETSKIKEIDKYTIENEPITSTELVERVAVVFVNEFCRRYSQSYNIYVFAGQGNNGADALAASRLLAENGYNVVVYLCNPTNKLSEACNDNKQRLKGIEGLKFIEIVKGIQFTLPALNAQDVVIDGLFGSGLNRELEGGFAAIVDYINRSEATVVSIDIPSGLFGDDNKNNSYEHTIQSDLTLTFDFPKLSFLMPENAYYVGEWKVLPIQLMCPDDLKTPYGFVTDEDIASLIIPREKHSHKGDYGHALLVAGGKGKIGASVLAAKGCMRSGIGLLTVHLPGRGETVMQTALPEAMVSLDEDADHITSLPANISKYAAIGIGPGIGVTTQTSEVVKSLIESIKKRNYKDDKKTGLVIDADALNVISSNADLLHQLPEGTILTPHVGEFDRIAGTSENAYERLQKARSIANENKICIVLKGAYTAVCTPNGQVFFNTSGNPGMATAGSGDVLTGIILGLLARGYRSEAAAVIGVYVHGLAGDLAASAYSEESLIAGDIVNFLGNAFKQIVVS